MKCPKCEEGTITKIMFKKARENAFICDSCETFWKVGEEIKFNSGHPFASHKHAEDREYTVEVAENEDHEHRPASYTKIT